jgi:SMODS-associated and fused to various effectors sensor domain/AAA ATPase domain
MGESVYLPEEPRTVRADEPLFRLAETIAAWAHDEERLRSGGAWIAGVYGTRGSGKTSLLWTIYNCLRERNEKLAPAARPRACVLPVCASPSEALFAPAATRRDDDVLFMLLAHLQKYQEGDRPPAPPDGFQKARTAEIRRKDLKRVIDYEQEIATSPQRFLERLIEVHDQAARTTSSLREILQKLLGSLKQEGETLPIFVDDLDLQPQRALEILEILHLFMNEPGVVVIVAADKDLLLHSIDRALERDGRHHPGLASALLAKYVPHEWLLPTPSETERLEFLFEPRHTGEPTRSALSWWWPDEAVQGLLEVRTALRQERRDRVREDDEDDEDDADVERGDEAAPLPSTVQEMVRHFWLPLAPMTYRGLKAFHNRLSGWQDRLRATLPHTDEIGLLRDMRRRYADLGLNRHLLRPFLAMMASLDVTWPELEILVALERSTGSVGDALSTMSSGTLTELARAGAMERAEDLRAPLLELQPEDLPVLSALGQKSRFARSDLGEVKRRLRWLAMTFKDWRRSGGGIVAPEERFLAISFHSNALEESAVLWRSLISAEEAARWHLDFGPDIRGGKPQPPEIRKARARALSFLRDEKELTSFQGRLEIFARAPLSFLIWTGWLLDRLRSVTVYNANSKTPFGGPAERLTFRDRGQYELAKVVLSAAAEAQPGDAGSAVVIIDLTPDHKVQEWQLDRFQRDGALVRSAVRGLFTRRSGVPILPKDLVPILQDILELIGRLREDHDIRHLHLAFAGPDVVAFFLGGQLRAQGMTIDLYDLFGDKYEWIFGLEESP